MNIKLTALGSLLTVGALATAGYLLQASTATASSTSGGGSATASSGAGPSAKKSPAAEPSPKRLTVTVDPVEVTGLVPGGSAVPTLRIANPNSQDVVLQTLDVAITGISPAPTSAVPCGSPDDFRVAFTNPAPVVIKRSTEHALPVTLELLNSSSRNQDGCKNKTFSFAFTATATSK